MFISLHFLADLWETSLHSWRNLVTTCFSVKKTKWKKTNPTEPSRTKPKQTEPNQTETERFGARAITRAIFFICDVMLSSAHFQNTTVFFLPCFSVLYSWFPLSAADHCLTGNGILPYSLYIRRGILTF